MIYTMFKYNYIEQRIEVKVLQPQIHIRHHFYQVRISFMMRL